MAEVAEVTEANLATNIPQEEEEEEKQIMLIECVSIS